MGGSLSENADESHAVGEPVDAGSEGADSLAGLSLGGLHGSALGPRNIGKRLAAMERLVTVEGHRLLDVGCATGEYTAEMATRFDHVDAVDIDPTRIEIFAACAPANVTPRVASVTDLPFETDRYDLVTMIEVLEHLPATEDALREIARVLRPGGHLVLTTPNRRWPVEQHGVRLGSRRVSGYLLPGLTWIRPLHRRMCRPDAFTVRDLRRLARASGLTLVGVTFMGVPLDSLGQDRWIHRAIDRSERLPGVRTFSQTIVGAFRAP